MNVLLTPELEQLVREKVASDLDQTTSEGARDARWLLKSTRGTRGATSV
jgi:hypothetical protein